MKLLKCYFGFIQLIVTAIAPAKIYMIKQDTIEGVEADAFIDLLVVVSGKCNTSFTELEPVLEMAYLKDPRVCCSLHGEGNVMEDLRNGHLFYSLHCVPENLVYDDKATAYLVTTPSAAQEMKTGCWNNSLLLLKRHLNLPKRYLPIRKCPFSYYHIYVAPSGRTYL